MVMKIIMKTLLKAAFFVLIGYFGSMILRDIYKSHDSHKATPIELHTPPVLINSVKYYTIELAGQVFHCMEYKIDTSTNSVQFMDSTGQNVVLYDLQHVTITEDK